MGEEKKSEILGQRLDADELDQVSGGCADCEERVCPNKGNVGGCTGAYYIERCQATVEQGSQCWRTDWYIWGNSGYTLTPEAEKLHDEYEKKSKRKS